MNEQDNLKKGWHLLADRFAFYGDNSALPLISKEITNEDIQQYLYTFHNETLSLEEIKKWRLERIGEQ